MIRKRLLSLVAVAGYFFVPSLAQAQPEAAPADMAHGAQIQPVKDVPLSLEDLIKVLDIKVWKWQISLPKGTKCVTFVREEWRKGEREPRLLMLGSMSMLFEKEPDKIHEVMVRWPDKFESATKCWLDGTETGVATPKDELYKDLSYGIWTAHKNRPQTLKMNESVTLVHTIYRSDNIYRGDHDWKPGFEQRNDRSLLLKMFASEKTGGMPQWKDGRTQIVSR